MGQQKGLGRACNPTPLTRRERGRRHGEIAARFNLDDGKDLAAARENIDLAGRAAPTARDDPPAAQPQMPQAQPLGQMPAPLGLSPPHDIVAPAAAHGLPSRIASARR